MLESALYALTPEFTTDEVAEILGVSNETVRRIEIRAVEKLRLIVAARPSLESAIMEYLSE